jgi:hypothetical protein
MYYLLSNADERMMMQSEKDMLDILTSDLELQAEICYTECMKGGYNDT